MNYRTSMNVLLWIYQEQPMNWRVGTRFFQKSLDRSHATIWTLIDCLKQEHSLSNLAITQHDAGINPPSQKWKHREINNRVWKFVAVYGNRYRLDFLRPISCNTA